LVDDLRVGTTWSVVTGGPGVAVEPTSQTQTAGSSAVFSVLATGAPSLVYHWQKNGLNLNDGGRISGANTANLTINNVLPADAGNYSVTITNSLGSTRSSGATLTVNDPAIITQPTTQVLPMGTNAVFQVVAAGAAPLSYKWYKEGAGLIDGARISGTTTAMLTVSNISAADIGTYSVRITNGIGNGVISSNADLYLAASIARRPNIIFILADDLGYGDLGVLFQNGRAPGLPREQTPNLDLLAAEGVQLRQHYCPAPICAPSRASLLLGVHQGHANVRDQQFDKAFANNHTLASVLRRAGYATAAVGKWGLAGDDLGGTTPADWPAYPTKRGFDYFFGYVRHGDGHEHYPKEAVNSSKLKECYDGTNNITLSLDKCYTADLFTARAKKWIADQRAANTNQPFFLYLAFDTPHAAYELPTQAYPASGGLSGGLQWLNTPGHMINTASGTVDSFFHPDYASATYDDDNNPLTPEVAWPEIFKRFATGVRRVDDAVGDLKKLLQDLAIDTNTLFVFTSDNGPTIEDYLSLTPRYVGNFFDNYGPLDGVKRDTLEGGIRMPTFARWPGTIPAGTTNQTPSQFHDWMPTFSELAGLPAPARTDGVSLVRTLLGLGIQRPGTVYVEYFDSGSATPEYPEFEPAHRGRLRNQMQVIGLGGYQGVRYDIQTHSDDFEIYDVTHDPKETTNLATNPSFAALQQQMKDRVLQLRRPDASAPRPYDAEFVPAAGAVAVTNGLINYAIYEGVWPWVPDVAMLTPISTGRVAGVTLSIRTRDTNYVAAFSGYIGTTNDGDYTFYLNTDAGAIFRVHDATVIDDDFTHTNVEVSGTIKLKAGLHPFRLIYRHGIGTNQLDFKYSGPGTSKQVVPTSVLYAACNTCAIPTLAEDDVALTAATTPVLVDALANDTGAGSLSISGVSQPLAGTAQIVSGKIQYTPNPGFLGEDQFAYTVSGGNGQSTATVRVQVCYVDGSYWFPFNQFSGFSTIDAGGFTTAQLHGFTNEPEQWVTGRWNQALSFDGFSNYLEIPNYLGVSGTGARTCGAWVKTTSTSPMALFSWGSDSAGNRWTVMLQSGALRVENSGGAVQGTRTVNNGIWHHVACTFTNDGTPNVTDTKLYVDGTPDSGSSQTSQTLNTIAANSATIGTDSQGRYFEGVLDEARIYDRALTAGEILLMVAGANQSAGAWYRRYYGWAPISWTPDEDADGMSRLAEYAFGGQPLIADAKLGLLSADWSNVGLLITYHRRVAGSHELNYQLESSLDMKGWGALVGAESSVIPSLLQGFEDVSFIAQVSGSLPLFVRLKVILP
jgi:arylsulfatase A-like enzyme